MVVEELLFPTGPALTAVSEIHPLARDLELRVVKHILNRSITCV